MNRIGCTQIEWKFDPQASETMSFEGYGAFFNNVDAYGDVIVPGAFASYLADAQAKRQPWPAMLLQHGGWGVSADDLTPIGVWTDIAEDGNGLRVKGRLANTPRGREVYELMRMEPRAAIDGMSIGYVPKEFEPRSKPEDPKRKLKRVDLLEISVVTFPANRLAKVDGVKSIEEIATIREAEEFLRAAGLSKSMAVALISRIKAAAGEPGGNDGSGDPAVSELAAALKRIRDGVCA
jgi:hypothetical protein